MTTSPNTPNWQIYLNLTLAALAFTVLLVTLDPYIKFRKWVKVTDRSYQYQPMATLPTSIPIHTNPSLKPQPKISGNWQKSAQVEMRWETKNKCLWADITTFKSGSIKDLDAFLANYYKGVNYTDLLSKKQYHSELGQSVTISSQGIGEHSTVYIFDGSQVSQMIFSVPVAEGSPSEVYKNCQLIDWDIDQAITDFINTPNLVYSN